MNVLISTICNPDDRKTVAAIRAVWRGVIGLVAPCPEVLTATPTLPVAMP